MCIQKHKKNLCDQNGGGSSRTLKTLKIQFLKTLPNFSGFYFIRDTEINVNFTYSKRLSVWL